MSSDRTRILDGLLELDELLERVNRLERENTSLRAALGDLQKAFLNECTAAIEREDYIWDFLWPVLKKEFPQFLDTMHRLQEILKPAPAADVPKRG